MATRRRVMLTVCLAAAAAALAACSVYRTSVWNSKSASGLEDETGRVVVELDCPRAATALAVELQLRCRSGRAQLRLVDPAGETPCRLTTTGGRAEQLATLPAQTGRYRCEVELDGFTGDYRVELWAHDDHRVQIEVAAADRAVSDGVASDVVASDVAGAADHGATPSDRARRP